MGREEIASLVVSFKNLSFLSLDDGRELVEVSDKDHLLASKGPRFMDAVEPEKPIHAIQKVCPDHGDFIYDYGIGCLVDIFFPALYDSLHPVKGYIGLEFEEGVNGLSPDIQSRNSGRSQDDHLLLGVLAKVFKKGGFSSAGLTGDEDIFRSVLKEIKGDLEFLIDFDL